MQGMAWAQDTGMMDDTGLPQDVWETDEASAADGSSSSVSGVEDISTWTFLDDDDSQLADVSIDPEWAYLSPQPSAWWMDYTGGYLYTTVSGDFVTSVDVEGWDPNDLSQPPSWWFNVGGLLVRDPASSSGSENWVLVDVGYQYDGLGVVSKTTVNSNTSARFTSSSNSARLAVCRVGDDFTMLWADTDGGEWQELTTYSRSDMPETVQMGFFVGNWAPGGSQGARSAFSFSELDHSGAVGSVDDCLTVLGGGSLDDEAADSDGDGVSDDEDMCPGFDDLLDEDDDTWPDDCDICPGGDDTYDSDGDGNPDDCDPCPDDVLDDQDGDGTCDSLDACPGGDDSVDTDLDEVPDDCDDCPLDEIDDQDGDGFCDSDDLCPGADDLDDLDGDGEPDACDSDRDDDGVDNAFDIAPDDSSVGENDAETLDAHDDALTESDARHLFRRAGFGGTPAEIDAAVQDGLEVTLDRLLTIEDEPEVAAHMAYILADESTDQSRIRRTQQAYMYAMCTSNNQLQMKMFFFFHDLWATSYVVDLDGGLLEDHADILMGHALGNVRDLAHELTVDPLMMDWLDGASNVTGSVNENYAREFWELFTLGEGNYTEQDINEAARAFTGYGFYWDDAGQHLYYDDDRHDAGTKTIFEGTEYEQTGAFGATEIVDLTFDHHPEASRHLARRLLELFVGESPDEDIVDQVAEIISDNDYEVEPALRAILGSQLFFSESARKNGVKTPLEHNLGLFRGFGMVCSETDHAPSSSQAAGLEVVSRLQGQELFNPPSVKGWDDDAYWLNHQWLLYRLNSVQPMIRWYHYYEGYDYTELLPTPDATAGEFLDHLAAQMDVEPTPDERDRIIEYLTTYRDEQGFDYRFPFDPTASWYFDLKAQGLVLMLAQHRDYQLR